MFVRNYSLRAMLPAAALALVVAATAGAQSSGAGDTKEISSYRLTDAGLAKYTQAQRNLEALPKTGDADCDRDDSENGTTIDQLVAKLNATPGASAAIKSAGMTPREYVVFGMAAFQAGMTSWALSQPGAKLPPGESMDNVNFYRKHEATLAKQSGSKKSSDCDDR